MREDSPYEIFRGTMNTLIMFQRGSLHLNKIGYGGPENASEYSDAYEEMCELISHNLPFWQQYLLDQAGNEYIQNLQLPF